MRKIFNVNGVATKSQNFDDYFIEKIKDGSYKTNIKIFKNEIFEYCSHYLNLLVNKLFYRKHDVYKYLEYKYFLNLNKRKFYVHAGLGAESMMSKEGFEIFIGSEINDDPLVKREDVIKYLYYLEIQALVADFEKLVIQSEELIFIFYEKFNEENIFNGNKVRDGRTTIYSMESRFINSILESIIVKSTSILDYLSKFVYEVENLPESFDEYPKRNSLNYKHGNTKICQINEKLKIKWSETDRVNTIFDESNEEILILKKLRNHIIHDGFLDVDNIIYENRVNSILKERFIPMPDFYGTNFTTFKGRKLFYSQDRKINLELPKMVEILMSSVVQTLNVLIRKYWFDDMSEFFSLTLSDSR